MRRRLPPHLRLAARLKLGSSIREARSEAGLTQEHLGRRIGLKGRAIYRWERNETAPTARHRVTLIREIHAVNPQAAAKLHAALTALTGKRLAIAELSTPAQPAVQSPARDVPEATANNAACYAQSAVPSPIRNVSGSLELAVLKMADELDVPARRVRHALARLLDRLRAANITLDAAQRELELLVARE